MAERKFRLTEEQAQELFNAFDQCKDGPTRTRYQAVRLYGTGYGVKEVEAITGCCRSTLMGWCRIYREQGIAGLIDKRNGGNRAKLTAAQIEELGQKLEQYTPAQVLTTQGFTSEYWSVESLSCAVQEWYGVTYQSRTSYYTLFDACGFSCQRPAKVYKSRSEAKIAEFEEQLEKN
jgi:putative transposase